ncbi:MAG: IS1634 family transposase, partial [Candidatus Desulfaltia sp.]|nr:IS1634 family transposase [Candidatus Desulfaltia sp.]
RLQLIVGLCEKIGVTDVFNKYLEKEMGRPSDMPAGVEAEIMIAGICVDEGYRPLYAIADYYEYKDLEGIFHYPIKLSQLNDDRFGSFLDDFYHAGCRNIFTEISARAFVEYGIAVRNINYDTTSKVMWGEYEHTGDSLGASGEISHISIDFGHSKDKRSDKKQIKIGLGTTTGVITDAKVLSGNMDDKTYNKENLEDVDKLLTQMKVDRSNFYYIADSALFTEENITRAKKHGINFITRMPDNLKVTKFFLDTPLPVDAKVIVLENAQGKEVTYRLIEGQADYEGHDCKLAVIYSEALEETKRNTCQKKVDKKRKQIEQTLKKYDKRTFKCEADAQKEVDLLQTKVFSKLKYHMAEISITNQEKKRPGRPSKNPEQNPTVFEYQLKTEICLDAPRVEDFIRRECTFILCSNDLSITGEKLLREYKTQSDVEKRFKVLKSPKFMNSLFLKTPHRVEALVYLLLISLMMLTVAERIVREELKKTGDVVLGTEKRKIKEPTLSIILQIMDRVRVVTYFSSGKVVREIRNMDDSCRKIINFLGLAESFFAWSGDG